MPRSHHRKKHKEHLKQYQHSHDVATSTPRGKAYQVFVIIGAIAGLAIGYFASDGSLVWSVAGVLILGTAGYFVGKNMDKQNSK